jgi:hypothetical protein
MYEEGRTLQAAQHLMVRGQLDTLQLHPLRRSSLTEKFRALALLVGKLVFEWNVVRRANPVDFGVKCRPKGAWSSTVVSLKFIRWHQL